MRALFWHLGYFKSVVTEKGRSPVVEEVNEKEIIMDNCLLAFISVESEDTTREKEVIDSFNQFLKSHAKNIGIKKIVLHPFAHLFCELAPADKAIKIIERIQNELENEGFEVKRTPFGWFNKLEIRAKGHPISRVARRF